MFDPATGSISCILFTLHLKLGNLQHVWLPHERLHSLMLLENARELVTHICRAMALKDQMHLISTIGATELAQPLAPRQISLGCQSPLAAHPVQKLRDLRMAA